MRPLALMMPAVAAAQAANITQHQNVTVLAIQTETTSYVGPDASLGNVTLYVPLPTVVQPGATSQLAIYANATQATQPALTLPQTSVPTSITGTATTHSSSTSSGAALGMGSALPTAYAAALAAGLALAV